MDGSVRLDQPAMAGLAALESLGSAGEQTNSDGFADALDTADADDVDRSGRVDQGDEPLPVIDVETDTLGQNSPRSVPRPWR